MADVINGCAECDADLTALLDGELGRERATELRAHLAGCARCRSQLARLERVGALLAGAPAPAVPPALKARLAERIAAASRSDTRLRGSVPARSRAPRRSGWSRVAGVVAAAAAAVALYLAVSSRAPAPPGGESSPLQIARPQPVLPPSAPQLAQRAAPPPAPVGPAPPARERSAPPPVVREVLAQRAEPAPATPARAPLDLEAVPDEDLGIALDLDTVEDYDVIANLDVLEALLAKESS